MPEDARTAYERVPAGVMPESILQGIAASGYFIWRGSTSHIQR